MQQPSGFHRIRHFGLLANNGRKEKIALARELLNVVPVVVSPVAKGADASADLVRPNFVCAHCGAQMILIETIVRGQAIRKGEAMVKELGRNRTFHDREMSFETVDQSGCDSIHCYFLTGGIDYLLDQGSDTKVFHSVKVK